MSRVPVLVLAVCMCAGLATTVAAAGAKIPVVFSTDVGSDFDDSAAIAYALSRDDMDVRLILTETGDTTARAKVVAKYLAQVNRTDIPIGIGVATQLPPGPLYTWAEDYPLESYPGKVAQDGVGALIDVVQAAAAAGETITIFAIAPATNFPSLLQRYPQVTQHAEIKAMSGSIFRGYQNSSTPSAEYNVKVCPSCSRIMYGAGWKVTTTPLDTCGTVRLSGDSYSTFLKGSSILAQTLAQALMYWARGDVGRNVDLRTETDIWYDATAVFLALDSPDVVYQNLHVWVTDDGYTRVNASAPLISVATSWVPGGETRFEQALAASIGGPANPVL